MQLITVAGSPSVGKTSVILRVAELLRRDGLKVGIAKFDSLSTSDDKLYEQKGFPVATGLSGALCPDHYFVSNIEDCWAWGQRQQLDLLISESAGLCNRCSPHVGGVLAGASAGGAAILGKLLIVVIVVGLGGRGVGVGEVTGSAGHQSVARREGRVTGLGEGQLRQHLRLGVAAQGAGAMEVREHDGGWV